nr:putative reverse transcriptase domain-containing protein [Tanacetum cinerariifolium]
MAMDIISVQASSVAFESTFSTSGRVLSIRRTRLTPASLKICMCLEDHLDAKERKQDKCPLEIPLDFEEDVFDDEVQRNEVIPLSDEEIALDASSEGTLSPGGSRDYRGKTVATGANAQPILTCYECGEKGHTRNRRPKRNNPQGGNATGRTYAMREVERNPDPNIVTGTFLLNNRYARVLFDSGSDKSFVNTSFGHLIDIEPVIQNTSYEVELADGGIISTNIVLKGCILNLVDHLFAIDLMPIELGNFEVIIGMDWLVERDDVIVYGKKVVHINKTLVVKGDGSESRLKVISCIKARKYIEMGCHLFQAQVTEKEPAKKRLEDVPVICDFLEVFPDDLPRLPPPRQVEFKIDLVHGATPVAHAPYRLALSEMKELSDQLQELSEKGFIRPSSSP